MFHELHKSATNLRSLEIEFPDIERREKECNERLSSACEHGSIAAVAVQRIIKDARTILDLCDARKKYLVRYVPRLREELAQTLRAIEEQWETFLAAEVLKSKAAHLAKAAVGFGGNLAIAERNVNYDSLPIVQIVQRASAFDFSVLALADLKHGSPHSKPGANVSKIALDFIKFARKTARQAALSIPGETPATSEK